jgi:hypothetical protein
VWSACCAVVRCATTAGAPSSQQSVYCQLQRTTATRPPIHHHPTISYRGGARLIRMVCRFVLCHKCKLRCCERLTNLFVASCSTRLPDLLSSVGQGDHPQSATQHRTALTPPPLHTHMPPRPHPATTITRPARARAKSTVPHMSSAWPVHMPQCCAATADQLLSDGQVTLNPPPPPERAWGQLRLTC